MKAFPESSFIAVWVVTQLNTQSTIKCFSKARIVGYDDKFVPLNWEKKTSYYKSPWRVLEKVHVRLYFDNWEVN